MRFPSHIASGCMAALLLLASGSAGAAASRYAIVVGHNIGNQDEEPLRFAERDAERFLDTLAELGQVADGNSRLILGKGPEEVITAIEHTAQEMQAEAGGVLFFYFAGHGDAENLHLGREILKRRTLIDKLASTSADLKLVVLDTCKTHLVGRQKGVKASPSFDIGVLRFEEHRGLVVISSSQEGEPAHESDVLGGSIFTHYFVSALRGAADTDNDGRVTLLEAYRFAYRHTVHHSAGASAAIQHPSFDMEWAGSGELVITTPIEANATLIVPAGEVARLIVFRQPSGTVVAEIISGRENPVVLAVPPGRLLVRRSFEDRFEVAQIDLPYGGRRELTDADFVEKSYESVIRRGGVLRLHPNELSVDYILLAYYLSGEWIPRQGVGLAYDFDLAGPWTLGVALRTTWSSYSRTLYDWSEIELGGTFRAGYSLPIGAATMKIRGTLDLAVVHQNRVRSDQKRLEQVGIDSELRERIALGAGGGLEIHFWVPLGARFGLALCARAMILGFRVEEEENTAFRAVTAIGGRMGFGYQF